MYQSMQQIKDANAKAGLYFFEPDTMRFFQSRICETIYAGRFFITSERNTFPVRMPREYTIREAKEDGSIETVGEFQQYATLAQAKAAASKLA